MLGLAVLCLGPEELVCHLCVADLQRGGDSHRPEPSKGTAYQGVSMQAWHKGVGQDNVPESCSESVVRCSDVLCGGKVTQATEERACELWS